LYRIGREISRNRAKFLGENTSHGLAACLIQWNIGKRKEYIMKEVTVFDCLVYYFIDYLEVIVENGRVTGFKYRDLPLE